MAQSGNRTPYLTGIYTRLLARYGPQGWWPLLRNGSEGWYSDYSPENLVREKTESERFEISIGAILTQNTNWKNAERALVNLKEAGLLEPGIHRKRSSGELTQYIRPSGYYNQKARKVLLFSRFWDDLRGAGVFRVSASGGNFGMEPADGAPPGFGQGSDEALGRKTLLGIWGIGPETADDILLYAFDRAVFVIDAYTLRLFSRLDLWEKDGEGLQSRIEGDLGPNVRLYKEFHGLVVTHAKEYCLKKPRCLEGKGCPLLKLCDYGKREL